jgi:hypothetical protein
LRQPNRLGALLPFDSGENAINPNAGILKISKQISDRYPFTINADQTEIHFTLNQNISPFASESVPAVNQNSFSRLIEEFMVVSINRIFRRRARH